MSREIEVRKPIKCERDICIACREEIAELEAGE